MTRVLAVDAGRTTCRLAVFDDGRLRARTEVGAGTTLADPSGATRVRDLIVAASADLGAEAEACTHVVAGFAGIWDDWASVASLADGLGVGLDVAEVVLTNDVVVAHAGAFDLGPGVVLSAGSGAVALGVGVDGAVARVDGWGYLVGDAGSGYWMGRRGLEMALRADDGRGHATALVELARERYGDLARLHSTLASADSPARSTAAFATAVVVAAGDGDPVAAQVVDEAVAELVTTVRAAAQRTHLDESTVPVVTVGGLFGSPGPVSERFAATLAEQVPTAVVRAPSGDALAGAALLAEDARHFESVAHRWTRPR